MDTPIDVLKCKRCHFIAPQPCILKRHLERKMICQPMHSDVSCQDLLIELKQASDDKKTYPCRFCDKKFASRQSRCIHEKAHKDITKCIYKIDEEQIVNKVAEKLQEMQMIHEEKIKHLQFQIESLKTRRNEKFYQILVEEYLQGTHKRLKMGVTDVTTDTVHAEVKNWECFKEAIGQLVYYNSIDPREQLHIYFFGKVKPRDAEHIVRTLIKQNFIVHSFQDTQDGIVIHCHNTQINVFHKCLL